MTFEVKLLEKSILTYKNDLKGPSLPFVVKHHLVKNILSFKKFASTEFWYSKNRFINQCARAN